MESTASEKRSEEFQRGIGKSTAEIAETRRFLESGEQPSAERQARYQAQKQADSLQDRTASEKRTRESMRGFGKSTAEIDEEIKAQRAYRNRVTDQPDSARNKNNDPAQGSTLINREKDVADQLESARSQNNKPGQRPALAALSSLVSQGQSFSKPSLFKYLLIFLVFAVPNDLIDALELTVVLSILSWFISLFLSLATMFVMWFADSEMKRVQEHMSSVEKYKATTTKALTRVASKLAKFAPKNPIAKVLLGAVLEMIPFISMLPWSCISVGLAYWDERSTFKQAKEQSDELLNASAELA